LSKRSDQTLLDEVLATWRSVNAQLPSLSFDELERCISLEISGKRRVGVLNRLQARICRLETREKLKALNERIKRKKVA
jgi:hypothetical protein